MARMTWLMLVVVAGCTGDGIPTDDSPTDDATTMDTESPTGSAGPNCDLVNNLGCREGSRCGLRIDSSNPLSTSRDCLPEGSQGLGDACAFDTSVADGGTGTSDCEGGGECFDGVCSDVCDAGDPNACVGGYCDAVPGLLPTGAGFCIDACDPVGVTGDLQDVGCPGDEACYPSIFDQVSECAGSFCDTENMCTHGSTCAPLNSCYPGKACAVLDASQSNLACAKLCDASFAEKITKEDLPVAHDPVQNGIAPWACGRDDDGGGLEDQSLPYASDGLTGHVCIPLGGETVIRYWGDLTKADGWIYGARLGVCVDVTEIGGNPYFADFSADSAGTPTFPRPGGAHLIEAIGQQEAARKILATP